MEAGSNERLWARVAECDAVLREEGDSPDPVSRRRVAVALDHKARALAGLGRHEECAEVLEGVVSLFADEPLVGGELFIARVLLNKGLALGRAGRHEAAVVALDEALERCEQECKDGRDGRAVAVRALSAKSEALSRLEAVEAASAVDWEIVRRFGEAGEPELRTRVAVALTRRAWWLLSEHRVDEALEVGDQLLRRFRSETDPEVQASLREILLRHTRTLLRVGSPRSESVAKNAVVVLAGSVGEGARLLGRRLRLDRVGRTTEWLKRSSVVPAAERAVRRGVPTFLTEQRKRAAQAQMAAGAVIDCFGEGVDRDQERMVATARIYSAVAAMLLGHVIESFRAFGALTGSGQEAVAEAFRAQAANVTTDAGLIAQFGAVANLHHRARTLGQGDPRITRIAFEESVRADAPGSPSSRAGRWFARLMAPGKT